MHTSLWLVEAGPQFEEGTLRLALYARELLHHWSQFLCARVRVLMCLYAFNPLLLSVSECLYVHAWAHDGLHCSACVHSFAHTMAHLQMFSYSLRGSVVLFLTYIKHTHTHTHTHTHQNLSIYQSINNINRSICLCIYSYSYYQTCDSTGPRAT